MKISVSVLILLFLQYLLYKILKSIYIFFIRSPVNLKIYGSWAVITGATDGIGAAYSKKLAEKGLNIILVGRKHDKLENFKKELEKTYNVSVKTILIDFSKMSSEEIKETIQKNIENFDIGILINNVGVSYECPEYYLQLSNEKINELIKVNIGSLLDVTSVIMPGMIYRQRGAIINISSSASLLPLGLLTVYSASKTFVNIFSKSLDQEYKKNGIFIQAVTPLYVCTKLSKIRKSSFFVPSPSSYVEQSIKTIGYEEETSGFFLHEIQLYLRFFIPNFILLPILFHVHKSIRHSAYKKKENTIKKD